MDRRNTIESFVNSLPSREIDEWIKYRKLCDKDFFFFVKNVGFPKYGYDVSREIHGVIAARWQDRSITRQACFMPRGTRKTTMFTVWSIIWEYLRDNNISVLLVSEKQDTATKWVQQMERMLLRNKRLRYLYPELLAVDEAWTRDSKWAGLYFDLPREEDRPEYTLECVGIRGAAQGGHFSLLHLDDLVGEKSRESPLVLQDALSWFDNCEELLIQPDNTMPDPSRIRLVGTHWGPGDYGEYIQENYPEFQWIVVPCRRFEDLSHPEQVTYLNNDEVGIGESNNPTMYSTEYYVNMAANPQKQSEYWCQHMNYPSGKSAATKFDLTWLRYYHIELRDETDIVVCDDGEEFPLKSITKYGLIDPGGFADTKMMKGSSRNALFIAGQPDVSSRKFVFATSAGRFKSPKEFMDIFFGLHLKWGVRLWKIEVIAAQKYIYKDILEEKRKRGITVSIVPMAPDVGKGAKDARIISLIDPCSRGEYFVHRSMKDLLGEYKSYPSGITKDLIDMWGVYNRDFSRRRPPADTMQMKEQEMFYIPDAVVPDIPSDRGVTGYGVSWE